ncbi:shikimate O-hydroxycinnamoyltransferase-like [Olea europaea subsp. europaea]|uniref:Shikimate O-hydroxycinnamoyltransferase-like n=1 Tax=Olea europaea subsp. europaea TaxID=158383 RepID=A0A8S0TJU4_OLEEU|nr:shikimate O-hydroxycinnamoyltransferase-like [Olea europaea subsp. europaea]
MDSSDFTVSMKQRDVVTAVLPVPEQVLPMSNLDLLIPPLDFGIFFCYKKSSDHTQQNLSPESMVAVIKKALAHALVPFYPFTGEIAQNHSGEPELLCSNAGVDFVHAYADIELKDLDLYHPDVSVHGKLVPIKMCGVLSVQVTELNCGGLVIGCTFDHRAADAHSANMFLTVWAEISQAKPTTHIPFFQRSIFAPRHPPQHDESIDKMYVLLSSITPPPKEIEVSNDHLLSRIYYIKAEEIDRLQFQASENGTRRSKIESFSAFLWKTIAEGGNDLSKGVKLGIIVDGRKRLEGREEKNLSLQNYFGNVLSIPYTEASVGELKSMTLKMAAKLVHSCVERAAREEHFSSLIDWVELHRPKPGIVKVYCTDANNEAAIVVSSGQHFPVTKLNFGWGIPAFGSYHFPWGGQTGYVMPMPSVRENGDWVVYMHLMKKHLDLIETKAFDVFRPFDSSHLKLAVDD